MKTFFFSAAIVLLAAFTTIHAQPAKKQQYNPLDLSMYPAAQEGFKRVYIQLPVNKNERELKVEVFIGKEQLVDCNSYFIMGEVKEQTVEGWGYTYYDVASEGQVAGTLMACPGYKKKNKFVHMSHPLLLDYNSKLPIVVYVPAGLEVRYKIWTAGREMKKARNS